MVDVKRQRPVIQVKWGPEYKVFSRKNGLKFSKKLSISPKMSVSPKKVFTVCAGLMMQRSLEVFPGCRPSVPPNPPLISRGMLNY